jgi:hydroxymethylbilane synthase
VSRRLRIATRKSALALWQAQHIKDALESAHPGVEVVLVGLTTSGDRWLSAPLSEVGGKGLFVKELEQAMLDGTADFAVHSMKDVPVALPDPFVLGAIGYRADVRDVLVGRTGATLAALPESARVGSASLRRAAQLKHLRGDLRVEAIRGNVGTRLAKLDAGEYDALVLASAGLDRLGLAGRVTEYLDIEVSLPAAGQGAIGIECLADRADLISLLQPLNDPEVAQCVTAERAVSRGLNADCSLPVAAYAECGEGGVFVRARVGSPDGVTLLHAEATASDPEDAGAQAAEALRARGATELLESLHGH